VNSNLSISSVFVFLGLFEVDGREDLLVLQKKIGSPLARNVTTRYIAG
jgi:hypothetical protein